MKRTLVAVAVLVVTGLGGYYAWTRAFGQETPRLDVQTAALQRGDVRSIISTSGTVKARVTVDVSVQVSGQVSERPVDYNSIVRKGDLLARIDPLPFETKIRQLDASISIAEASVAIANAGLEKATINAAKAASDLEKNRTLAATGAVTKAALETAENSDKLARADLSSANAQVQNANAGLIQRKAERETAEIDLDHTNIRAPIDGIVVDRLVEVGQTVAASSTAPKLFTLAQDLSSIDITGQVDESDVARVASGNPVTFRVDAFPGATFSGDVWQVRLAPTTAQNVVTYTIIVRANNPGGRLLPGMTANLDIVTGDHRNVMVVSNEALRFTPRGAAATLVAASARNAPPSRPATPAPPSAGGSDLVATLQRTLGLDNATVVRIRAAFATQNSPLPANAAPRSQGAGQRAQGGPGPQAPGARPPGGAGGLVPPPAAATLRPEDGQPIPVDLRVAAQQASATDDVLRAILTPAQFERYQAMQADIAMAPIRGSLWVRETDGTLTQHSVELGLASLNTTEIVAPDLPEGARIVLRVREAQK